MRMSKAKKQEAADAAVVLMLTERLGQAQVKLDVATSQIALQSSIASETLKKCDALQRELWSVKSDLVTAQKQAADRKEVLRSALNLLKLSEQSYDFDCGNSHVMLAKKDVADFFLDFIGLEDS